MFVGLITMMTVYSSPLPDFESSIRHHYEPIYFMRVLRPEDPFGYNGTCAAAREKLDEYERQLTRLETRWRELQWDRCMSVYEHKCKLAACDDDDVFVRHVKTLDKIPVQDVERVAHRVEEHRRVTIESHQEELKRFDEQLRNVQKRIRDLD